MTGQCGSGSRSNDRENIETVLVNDPAKPTVVAFYLPQYHCFMENDRWWGQGFTDWCNVKQARPLFQGHRQPRVPLGGSYYNLEDPSVLEWQASIALQHGVSGFCHYHYWFDGIQLLNRPTDTLIGRRDIQISFCLAWANASWSRRWDSDEGRSQVLIRQTYIRDPARWDRHCDYLLRAWTDDRAIKVDGKPVFIIYAPNNIPHLKEMTDLWRSRAEDVGFPGLYILGIRQADFLERNRLGCLDGLIEFQPAFAMFMPAPGDRILSWRRIARYKYCLPPRFVKYLKYIQRRLPETPTLYKYDYLWKRLISRVSHFPANRYACAFVDWDNTPRYKHRALIVQGATPDAFEKWFGQLLALLMRGREKKPLLFINAWNEWAEGAYLEPDEGWGYEMLRAIKRAQLQLGGKSEIASGRFK